MAEMSNRSNIPRRYENYLCRLLENLAPRCDQSVRLSEIPSSERSANVSPNLIFPNMLLRAT
ncbi:hypothetical protein [Bradyrhizobium sp. USDA 3256]